MIKNIFSLVLDNNGQLSIRRVLALLFSIDLIINIGKAINILVKVSDHILNCQEVHSEALSALMGSLPNVAMLLGLEAGLIASLLALTTWQNNIVQQTSFNSQKVDNPDK